MPRLFLLPTLLGEESNPQDILPSSYKAVIEDLRVFVVENIRSARRFLRKVGFTANFDTEVRFFVLDEHTSVLDLPFELAESDIGLLSEAGLPCIADPGAKMVRWAQQHGMRVVPVSGPSSIFLALMASGLNGQNFTFHGYLPVHPNDRVRKIRSIEQRSLQTGTAEIFIETPYRNKHLYASLLRVCREETLLCVARSITLPNEDIQTHSIAEWRKIRLELGKENVVFLIQAI
ncbi:MAG: SAM-dependent methyltransferase [Bacteroidales bacterium]|jgi:16S rRNA (cytidine1402-2'-O)-methyltransferase|nr:SAM-dependent methyltransferase [Bacteroidales bacterium]